MAAVAEAAGTSVAAVAASAAVGAYARWRGVLTPAAVKLLERGVQEIWTPALILYTVVPTVQPHSLVAVWPMAIMCASIVTCGLASGALCGRLLARYYPGAFPHFSPLLMVAAGFPNSFSVPLTLFLVLADEPVFVSERTPTPEHVRSHLTSLFVFSYVVWVFVRWSVGYPVLTGACQSPRVLVNKMVNPPTVTCLAAVALGLGRHALAVQPGSWFQPVKTAVEYPARCLVPITLLCLGARLGEAIDRVRGPAPSREPPTAGPAGESAQQAAEMGTGGDYGTVQNPPPCKQATLPWVAYPLIIFLRQGVGAFLGVSIGYALNRWADLQDPVAVMVAMLQACGPPMINLAVLAGLGGQYEVEAAKVLLCTYVASLVTWTVSITACLTVLQQGSPVG